ncbi:MAG: helix-turn-helix domain-containing protein, partial [Geminicoccaceae bacterium]|nr:helix-turn-helix domain-containing protein [Geminicoccaceae bacterium]
YSRCQRSAEVRPNVMIAHLTAEARTRETRAPSAVATAGIERRLGIGVTISVAAGQTIVLEGDPLAHAFRVIAGTVRLYKAMSDGRRQVVDFVGPGGSFGLLGQRRFPFTAEAVGPTTLIRYPRHQLEAAILGDLEAAAELVDLACQELERAQTQMLLLGRKSAEEKIASFLLARAARSPDAASGSRTTRLAMSRQDMADYLGLTIETVSRTFSRLKQQGLISLPTPQQVALHKIEPLAELAEGR